jgi:DNA-binding NarL/FixJ family response regulator
MKVLVVDNQDLIVHSLTQILIEDNIAQEIVSANGMNEGLEKAKTFKPNLIICDYKMPDGNGLDFFKQLKSNNILAKFLVLSILDEGAIINTLYNEGINGYINKECSKSEIKKGINLIIQGQNYFCEFTKKALKKYNSPNHKKNLISKRELEILKLILHEKKNQDIADLLSITVSTVETHKKNLIKKLGVKSSIGLVKYALDNNL